MRWEIWIAAALILAGAEAFVGSLKFFALAVACLPAALVSALGGGPQFQALAFAIAALFELPLVGRMMHASRRRRLSTNAEAIVGKRVRVLQTVKEHEDGVVLLTGEHWKARSAAGELKSGGEARVVALDGLCLIVVPERS